MKQNGVGRVLVKKGKYQGSPREGPSTRARKRSWVRKKSLKCSEGMDKNQSSRRRRKGTSGGSASSAWEKTFLGCRTHGIRKRTPELGRA